MKLEVYERLVLMSILPQAGDFVTLKLVRKLREALSFNEKEIAEISFQNHWRCPKCQKVELSAQAIKCQECGVYMVLAGSVSWDEEKAIGVVKDVHMGRSMHELCASTLKKLSDESKLTEQHMSLYELFVEADEKDEE